MYKKCILLSSLILMSGFVVTQAQDIADSIPTGIKVYVVGDTASYDVYGGDIAPVDIDSAFEIAGYPEENGYFFMGNANSTHEFYGSYFYYLVRSMSYGPVQVDAFEILGASDCFWDPIGCNGPDDPLWYSSNFFDPPCDEWPIFGDCPLNCQGPPDGEYSCLYHFSLMSGMVCEEPQLPDLIGEFSRINFQRPPDSGADLQAKVTLLITNIGEADIQPEQVINMAFFLRPIDAVDSSEDIFVSTLNNILIGQLGPGRSKRIRLSVPIYIPAFTYGTYRLGVYIDSSNDVIESNEGNNVIISNISNAIISIHGGIPVWIPDLTGEISKISFKDSPSPGLEGRTVIDVNNIGTGQTASKQVIDIEICLRPCDATDDTDDITLLILEDQSISKLTPGRSKTFRATLNLPADLDAGEYLLVAKIDSSEVLVELNENNNEALSECFEVASQ